MSGVTAGAAVGGAHGAAEHGGTRSGASMTEAGLARSIADELRKQPLMVVGVG